MGREHELAETESFLDALERGPAALVLEGEAGIGKTTLWREAAALGASRGYRLLIARPTEPERSLSFAGLADLLGEIEAEIFERLPSPQRHALDAALLRGEEEAQPDPRAVFAAFLSILRQLSSEAPVVIAVDDVQWLDPPSARAAEFAARRVRGDQLGFLVTTRVAHGSHADRLIAALDHIWSKRVHIGPFTLAATHRLLRERLDRSLTRPTLLRIQQASGGNPFFALEIARTLGSRELRPDEPLPVPGDVGELVRRRIGLLPRTKRRALLRAAAASAPTAHLIGTPLESLLRTGLVQELPARRIAFAHPLYAAAVYEVATSKERREAHGELAELVEDVEERARHLALAAEGPDEAISTELDRAAERARARGAPETAAELQERGFELTPATEQLAASRRALAAADDHLRAGALDRAHALLGQALQQVDEATLRAHALHLLAEVRFREDSVPEAIALLHQAAEAAGDDPESRTPIELDLVFAFVSVSYEFEAARPHVEALLSCAERLSDPASLAEALATATMSKFLLGAGVDEATLARALALEDPERPARIQFRPTLIAGFLAFYSGHFDRARALLYPLRDRLRERAAEADLPLLVTTMAWLECCAGDVSAARRLAEEGHEAAMLTESETMAAVSLAFGALAEAYAGQVESSRDRIAAALQATERTGYGISALWAAGALGFLELSLGNASAADQALGPLTELIELHGLVEPVRAFFVPDEIEALVELGHLGRAERLTEMLAVRGRELDRPWALATSGRCRALVLAARGELQAALDEIEQALSEHERLPMPVELGRTLLVKGQLERRAKQKLAARESLEQALGVFDRLGTPLWAERAQHELARLGLRRATRSELTDGERRVAELAASGLTNREVAEQLFMSPKTVEANIARVYRKLGIRSRAELGARLAKVGSTAPPG